MATTQPIRSKSDIRELAFYYLKLGQLRNYILIVFSVYTALRISDILCLQWDDVFDFKNQCIRESISIVEGKSRKSKTIALNSVTIDALNVFATHCAMRGNYLFENPRTKKAISRIQAYRIIRDAAQALHFQFRVSCHSLRKTFGYHAWKDGMSPAVIMEIFNHSSFAVTRRYLGVTQDDMNEVYLRIDLFDN